MASKSQGSTKADHLRYSSYGPLWAVVDALFGRCFCRLRNAFLPNRWLANADWRYLDGYFFDGPPIKESTRKRHPVSSDGSQNSCAVGGGTGSTTAQPAARLIFCDMSGGQPGSGLRCWFC